MAAFIQAVIFLLLEFCLQENVGLSVDKYYF